MAATLITTDVDVLLAALPQLHENSVAYRLVVAALDPHWEMLADDAAFEDAACAEVAFERFLEDQGYEDARAQEAWEARQGFSV